MIPEVQGAVFELRVLWDEAEALVRRLPPQALIHKQGAGFNSISALVTHLAGSQRWWMGEVVANRAMHRDRDAEFRAEESDSTVLVSRLQDAAALVTEILGTLTSEMLDQTRLYREQPMTVRRVLTRLLAHTARHVGQMQIVEKLWASQDGAAPFLHSHRSTAAREGEAMDLLKQALAEGLPALDEYRAERFLSAFGIPVSRESVASDPAAAATAAETIGFPVVLKVMGHALYHKTEVGGVVLDVKSSDEVETQSLRLLKIPGCEALLVQEMVKGDRELVCGMIRDPQLGPCVMFGLGGIFTEALNDAVFRVAPLALSDALEMVGEIRSVKVLGAFRGQSPVKLETVARLLVALGDIGLQHEAVQAIDINPIKIRADGTPVAVDALVSLAGRGNTRH
jgi:acetyl-CoA synthetase (ADP-forming)